MTCFHGGGVRSDAQFPKRLDGCTRHYDAMTPRFQTPAVGPVAAAEFLARSHGAVSVQRGFAVGATRVERIHSLLRGMPDPDWARFKVLMQAGLDSPMAERDLDMVERLFRKGEAIGGCAGHAVGQVIDAITSHAPLLLEVKRVQERMREQVRFVLREMTDQQWEKFKTALEDNLRHPVNEDEIAVLELVFRVGESVRNVEIAATAAANRASGLRLIHPEVARRNAAMRARANGLEAIDPEAAYREAKKVVERVEEASQRAENTLANRYVRPGSAYQYARNTVFRLIDWILETPELMGQVTALRKELEAVAPLTRERMRWVLNRMPMLDRIQAIRLIPLNTILMFQEGETRAKEGDLGFRATRDRRLAYDCFVRGHSDGELAATFGLALNAVKNALGEILQALADLPIARQLAHGYLARMDHVQPMTTSEVRRRMKSLDAERRAEIVNGIPPCAWKIRHLIQLHKHVFLDYLSGEWALETLVEYYNLEKRHRLTGTFRFEQTLTVRGANAAIGGMLLKIAQEPELRQRLSLWTSPGAELVPVDPAYDPDLGAEDFLPMQLNHAGCPG